VPSRTHAHSVAFTDVTPPCVAQSPRAGCGDACGSWPADVDFSRATPLNRSWFRQVPLGGSWFASVTLSILRAGPFYPDRVPTQPKTPLQLHSFRVSDAVWEAAKKQAEERGETLAEVLRAALARYLTE
jgi:hypothetical protein